MMLAVIIDAAIMPGGGYRQQGRPFVACYSCCVLFGGHFFPIIGAKW